MTQIVFSENVQSHLKSVIKDQRPSALFIITDREVAHHLGIEIFQNLHEKTHISFVPKGEAAKQLNIANTLWQEMETHSLDKESLVIAFGGGALLDLSGFVASTYLRGVSLCFIPTTLLAQVDASIGGKNGINTKEGKNRIGTLYHPDHLLINTKFLDTLPLSLFKTGLSEVIKYGVIYDEEFFNQLENSLPKLLKKDHKILNNTIKRCIDIKRKVISLNQRDLLNYGHTVGHALERFENFSYLHGEAVAIGMHIEAQISHKLGYLSLKDLSRQKNLLLKTRLPTDLPPSLKIKQLIPLMLKDKKNIKGGIHFILPNKIGSAKLVLLDNYTDCLQYIGQNNYLVK